MLLDPFLCTVSGESWLWTMQYNVHIHTTGVIIRTWTSKTFFGNTRSYNFHNVDFAQKGGVKPNRMCGSDLSSHNVELLEFSRGDMDANSPPFIQCSHCAKQNRAETPARKKKEAGGGDTLMDHNFCCALTIWLHSPKISNIKDHVMTGIVSSHKYRRPEGSKKTGFFLNVVSRNSGWKPL